MRPALGGTTSLSSVVAFVMLSGNTAARSTSPNTKAVIGTAALEFFEDGALLRSVAVETTHRSFGAGARLVEGTRARVEEARAGGYLLATTAHHYFPRFGFSHIVRDMVPPARCSSRPSSRPPACERHGHTEGAATDYLIK